MQRAKASIAATCCGVYAEPWSWLCWPGRRCPHAAFAAVNVGVLLNDCLNAAGEATGLGRPSTPCERRHEAKRSMSRLAWATVTRTPLSLTVADESWCGGL